MTPMNQQGGRLLFLRRPDMFSSPPLASVAGNPRKASTDVNARSVDDPKRAGKARKGHGNHAQPADI